MYKLYTLNVGQGDSLIIQSISSDQSKWAVIDCHNPSSHLDSPALKFLKQNHVNDLDLVVLTHPDYDHYSGLRQLINYFTQEGRTIRKFKGVIKTPQQIKGSINSIREQELKNLYDEVISLHGNGKLEFSHIASDVVVNLHHCSIRALSPYGPEMDRFQSQAANRIKNPKARIDKNSISAIIALEGLGCQSLLCADASREVIETVLVNWKKEKKIVGNRSTFDVIKVSHHGAESSHNVSLWKEFTVKNKSVALISAGEGYGHPHEKTVKDIVANKVKLYSTNQSGYLKKYHSRLVQNIGKSGLKPRIIDAIDSITIPIPLSSDVFHGDILTTYKSGSIAISTQTNHPPL